MWLSRCKKHTTCFTASSDPGLISGQSFNIILPSKKWVIPPPPKKGGGNKKRGKRENCQIVFVSCMSDGEIVRLLARYPAQKRSSADCHLPAYSPGHCIMRPCIITTCCRRTWSVVLRFAHALIPRLPQRHLTGRRTSTKGWAHDSMVSRMFAFICITQGCFLTTKPA